MDKRFERNTFGKRLTTMLTVDFQRILKSPFFYIMVGICFVIPVLILVMTTMMDGTVTVNPQTGEETVIESFKSVWEIIGSVSTDASAGADAAAGAMAMDMSITAMCNINLLYFFVAVLVCIFVSDDFRSGYAKNLFTIRAQKSDYVVSKTLACFFGGTCMILAFFAGALLGGAISGLSFEMTGFNVGGLVFCILSKIILMGVFVPIYLIMAVIAKQRAWLSILLSMMVGMFLFMMIPMLTPLNATIMHTILCLAGGAMFSSGLGAISSLILKKRDIL